MRFSRKVIGGLVVWTCLAPAVGAGETTSSPSSEADVVLVAQGQPRAVIVWDPQAANEPSFSELSSYVQSHLPWAIEQVTGVRLEPTTTMPSDDAPAVVIGKSLLSASARQRLDRLTKRFDTRMLTCQGGRVYLAGATARGDAGAIADFIHDELGVHLYGPEPIQWQIPHTATLRVRVNERVWTPAFVQRRAWYDGQTIPHRGALADDYERFQAIAGAGPSARITASHAWSRILPPSLFAEHPEYFAEVDGRRVPKQACISHPAVADLFAAHYDRLFSQEMERESASISPNDGSSFCECSRCRAISPDLSTRLLTFFNEVGRRVAAKHPDRRLAFYAYAYNEDPPKEADLRIERNVIPVLAHYFTDKVRTIADAPFNSANWHWLHDRLEPWRKLATGDHFLVREYMAWWYGPWPMYRSMLASVRAYAEHGVDGIIREYQGRDLGTDLHMYLELRMMTDPYQDGGRLLERVMAEYYGPAGEAARRVAFEIEDALRRGDIRSDCGLLRGCPQEITGARLREWAGTLLEAENGLDDPYRARLARDRRYLDVATRYVDFFEVYDAAVRSARSRPLAPPECGRIRQLLDRWLDGQKELVRDGLKRDSYLDRCIARDVRKIQAFLDEHKCPASEPASPEPQDTGRTERNRRAASRVRWLSSSAPATGGSADGRPAAGP